MVLKKNCLLCTLFIWLKLCPIFGIGGILSIKCDHTKNVDTCEVKRSTFYTTTILITITATLTVSLFDLKYYVEAHDYTIISSFKFVTDMILVVNTIHFQIVYLLLTDDRAILYRGLIDLLENGHLCGLNTFLSVDYIKKFRRCSNLVLVAAIVFVAFYTTINLIYIKPAEKFLYVKTVVTVYSFCIDLLNLTIVSSLLLVYNKMLQVTYDEVTEMMVARKRYDFRDFFLFLTRIRRLHSAIYFNVVQLNKCSNPIALVWFALTCSSLILNVFITIAAFIHNSGGSFDATYYIVQIRIVVLLSLMTPAIFILDGLGKSGQNVASFLFQFPITRLKPEESAQVELLITTLHTQKLCLKASDLFTISLKLLVSISGTVVTYVLVALQFRALGFL